jgi:hypothetical protein
MRAATERATMISSHSGRSTHPAPARHTPESHLPNPNPDPDPDPQSPDQPTTAHPAKPGGLIHAAFTAGTWIWAAAAWTLLAWWALGQTLSDRFAWSQWARWTPTELVVALMGILIAIVWVVRRLTGGGHRRGRTLRIVWAVVLGWLILVPWRTWVPLGRLLLGTPTPAMTVMCWNANAVPGKTLHNALPDTPLDLLIIVNPLNRVDWTLVSQHVGRDTSQPTTSTGLGPARIISKYSILRRGSTHLGLAGRLRGTRQEDRRTDPGWAGFFEIDTTADLGKPIVVWVIDLPSDPAIPRVAMTQAAADAIHNWQGPAMTIVDGTPTALSLEKPGFPEPDLIIGDFNIPRGSWSLSAITGSLSNAWTDGGMGFGLGGGFGPLGSWPRKQPVLHIDQAFLATDLRSTSYDLIDLGTGKHRAQILTIAPKK